MRLLCLVNAAEEAATGDTTPALLRTAAWRGHEIWVGGVMDLSFDERDRVLVAARPASLDAEALRLGPPQPRDMENDFDVVLLRTNPGRDRLRSWAHHTALEMMGRCSERGLLILSEPQGLQAAASKLYLSALPHHLRPDTLVTRDPAALLAFLQRSDGRCVLKPLNGSQGRDVFLVQAGDLSNFNQIVDVLTRSGFAMAQRYLPEAIHGDTRLLLLEGEPINLQGQIAAVRRIPGGQDFRSNVHVGGTPAPAEMSPALSDIAQAIGPRLRADGIFLAGLDVIGDKVVEINVFSPGGIQDASRFSGVDFTTPIIAAIERRLSAHKAA